MGDRIFQIRCDLGGGARDPLPMGEFAERLEAASAGTRRYHASDVSRWERGMREPSMADLLAIAAVDPKRRGVAWLAFASPEGTPPLPEPATAPKVGEAAGGKHLSEDERLAADALAVEAAAERAVRESAPPAPPARRRKSGGEG